MAQTILSVRGWHALARRSSSSDNLACEAFMTQSSPAYVPPNRKLEAISRRMHPIVNMGGWVSTWYGAHWRYSIPMEASTTSNGLTLNCDWRTRCRCHGTASMCLTDGFTRARFRSLGYSTFGRTRLAGRVWGHKCRCIIAVPPWWWLRGGTIESTITCVSGQVRKVEVKRPSGGWTTMDMRRLSALTESTKLADGRITCCATDAARASCECCHLRLCSRKVTVPRATGSLQALCCRCACIVNR